ncbi:MAG: T9SS type A sorting domain-containing protein [Flavobacteriales bacterium]
MNKHITMRFFYTLIFALIFSLQSYSYSPLLQGNQLWHQTYYGWVMQYGDLTLGDPAIVLDVVYYPVYLTYTTSPDNPIFIGHLWEDEVNELVYYRENETDHLLYNFNVAANDVISIWSYGMETEIVITNVEMVTIDGEQRKKISYSQQEWFTGYYIEGVGSNNGLFDYAWANIADAGQQLTCYYEGTDLIWTNPTFTGVCESIQQVSELDNVKIDIYPNPSTTEINLEIPSQISAEYIEITDVSGRLISREKVTSTGLIKIDISNFSKGNYFLNIITDSSKIVSTSFIKN